MVASKFLNDDGEEDEVDNAEWATSAKIELSELNQLEREFLQAIVQTKYLLKCYSVIDLFCLDVGLGSIC